MRYSFLLPVLASLLCFTACTSNGPAADTSADSATTAAAPVPATPPSSKLSTRGTSQLLSLVTEYYALKDAFVASKGEDAAAQSAKVAAGADSLRSLLGSDSAIAILPQLDTIRTESGAIHALGAKDIETMRQHFEKVSDNLYALLQKTELKNANVYHQYCPMAFNEKGAYWLSNDAEIRNPYFGKKMLECGETTDSLQ